MKTGHLLKKIRLSESYPGTVCQKAYSQSVRRSEKLLFYGGGD